MKGHFRWILAACLGIGLLGGFAGQAQADEEGGFGVFIGQPAYAPPVYYAPPRYREERRFYEARRWYGREHDEHRRWQDRRGWREGDRSDEGD